MAPLPAFAHPTLSLPVTDEQRDRSVDYLQHAYAQGRIAKYEFDERVHQVLVASTRAELNAAFAGLANVPVVPLARRPLVDTSARGATGRNLAAVAHWSGLVSWAIGPALVYAASPANSFARKEAAKAVNFQLLYAALAIGAAVLLPNVIDGQVESVLAVLWFVFTIMGGLRAHRGIDWKNPLQKALPLKVAREDGSKGPQQPALMR